jgi:hypothetical protein
MARSRHGRLAAAALAALLCPCPPLMAQETDNSFGNPVARLQDRLARGEIKLTYEDGHGYLRSLLAALDIPEESQVLPFTRSSFLANLISPKQPRAIYFNDDVAVAVAQGGSVVELIANDREDGPVFYTFATRRRDNPRPAAEISRCTFCHNRTDPEASTWIVANIPAAESGQPLQRRGGNDPSFDFTDHTTSFENRWGGWYVTGAIPAMRHRGNVTGGGEGVALTDLSSRFDLKQVLQPTSDIVALMTLEHQTGFANRAAALTARYSEEKAAALAAYMTFADEAALPGPIQGNSPFGTRFAAAGPRDAAGRSLRAFDLKTRLFRYPLSYMIYSNAFAGLTPQARAFVWRRLHETLRQTAAGRDAIAIVAATKPDAPAYWRE